LVKPEVAAIHFESDIQKQSPPVQVFTDFRDIQLDPLWPRTLTTRLHLKLGKRLPATAFSRIDRSDPLRVGSEAGKIAER